MKKIINVLITAILIISSNFVSAKRFDQHVTYNSYDIEKVLYLNYDYLIKKDGKEKKVFYSNRQIECMAQNMYFEARGDKDIGMIAVGYVVLNRMNSKEFPNTPCEVINEYHYNKKTNKKICQFSWKCEIKVIKIKEKQVYERSLILANLVLNQTAINPVNNSLYFHSVNLKKVIKKNNKIKIGSQFYYS